MSVIANGDINLNGSRIATYDGGNVTVASLNGNIDAGNGGSGFVTINAYYVDPSHPRRLRILTAQCPSAASWP